MLVPRLLLAALIAGASALPSSPPLVRRAALARGDGHRTGCAGQGALAPCRGVWTGSPPPAGSPPREASIERLRGGGGVVAGAWSPDKVFNSYFGGLALAVVSVRGLARAGTGGSGDSPKQGKAKEAGGDAGFKSLQAKFLAVFWLFKLADWLHGPYFYEVYASKIVNGVPMSQETIARMFLCGFASSMLFGTFAGSLVDQMGRKAGCLVFAVMYALSALSTRSSSLATLVAGRVLGGTATSLLFSAPEAWFVGEHQAQGHGGSLLGGAFELAYFGDGIMAILAGKLAGLVARRKGGKGAWLCGPSSPFELSVLFLTMGAAVVGLSWGENFGAGGGGGGGGLVKAMKEAAGVVLSDRKVLLTGAVQSLFEGAMYIFVLQWPPAFKMLVEKGAGVPFGTIFACLMTACMLGSSVFGLLLKAGIELESFVAGMVAISATSLAGAAWALRVRPKGALHITAVCFFLFEACVGLYFPSVGTLRSKYVPNSHKSAIMNLFRVPLNIIVITTFLQIDRLGVVGALACASCVLSIAFASALSLRGTGDKKEDKAK